LHSTFDNNDIGTTSPPLAISLLLVNAAIVKKLDRIAYASLPLKCFALYMTRTDMFSKTQSHSKTEVYSLTAVLSRSATISDSKQISMSSNLGRSLLLSATEHFSKTQDCSGTNAWLKTERITMSDAFDASALVSGGSMCLSSD
jgi:hypothetical protein